MWLWHVSVAQDDYISIYSWHFCSLCWYLQVLPFCVPLSPPKIHQSVAFFDITFSITLCLSVLPISCRNYDKHICFTQLVPLGSILFSLNSMCFFVCVCVLNKSNWVWMKETERKMRHVICMIFVAYIMTQKKGSRSLFSRINNKQIAWFFGNAVACRSFFPLCFCSLSLRFLFYHYSYLIGKWILQSIFFYYACIHIT